MTRTLLVLFGIALFATPALSQEKKIKPKYGKITEEELAMTAYSDDPGAAAVVLFDKGEYHHSYNPSLGFTFEYERHIRIKIFKKEAYKYADVRILHYKDERVTDLKACSYNVENGKITETPLEKDNTFEENLTSRILVKKLTIPAVKEGSVIDYKCTLKDVNLPDWVFQRIEIPTVWSEFKASVPTFVEYKKLSQGWIPFSVAEEEQRDINAGTDLTYTVNKMHFVQENIPALKPEPYVLSPTDYLSQINFDVTTIYTVSLVPQGVAGKYKLANRAPKVLNNTWENLGKELLEEVYKPALQSSKYTEDEAKACVAGKTTPAEKTAAIYEFIGKNYQVEQNPYIWLSAKMEALTKNKKGSPTDINLLLINMLQKAGVPAYALVISTRENGKILPFRVTTDAFSRVITAVENEDNTFTLIDASAWPNPVGLLPEEDINNEGLLLRDAEHIEWLPLTNKVAIRSAVLGEISILPDGRLTGNLTFSESGYGAVNARRRIHQKNANSFLQEKFPDLLSDAEIKNIKVDNLEQWQEPSLKGSFEMEQTGAANVSGGKIYLSPSLGLGLKENPFKNPDRKFNIELGIPSNKVYNITYKIPAGYRVEEAPKSTKLVFGDNALVFDYLIESNIETLKLTIRQNIKDPYIAAEEYKDLQQFFGIIVAKLEEQVVFTKI